MSERGGRTKTGKRTKAANNSAGVAPIYKRLPHGPHRLARGEVVRHQRARIHGAMIEAVAERGYERTSVKQVIGLAGVSRRSFYEQFANKEECFLATFDGIAQRELQRMGKAYLAAEGGFEDRLSAAYDTFVARAADNRKAMALVIVDAQTAGATGTARLRKAMSACEQMLGRGFHESAQTGPLPTPIVRAITGGLHGATAKVLSEGCASERPELSDELLQWTLLFETSAATQMEEALSARVGRRMRDISLANAHRVNLEPSSDGDVRERILHEALRLAALHEYRDITAPQIADEARVPIEVFLELFATRDECYLGAVDMVGEELLAIAADPDLVSSDWPGAVRNVLGRLLSYLGDHPLYSRTIAQEAFSAGPEAMQRTLELLHSIATLLTEGAPVEAPGTLTVDGVAGALLHTVRCQVVSGRIQLLPALSDHLSYVVLAPFIGAEAALQAVTEDAPR